MTEKANNPFSGGMERIIDDLADKKRRYLEGLENLPYRKEIIPAIELERLQTVNSLLQVAIERFEREVKKMEPTLDSEASVRAKNEAEKRILDDLIIELDKVDVWSHKFSTESQGVGEGLRKTPDDSVYYMTPSGVSLRLKMANRGKGIRKVIQPIMEKIFFEKIGEEGVSEISETPKIGYFVQEYGTQDFFDTLSNPIEGDYESSIKIYERGGKPEIPKLDNIKFDHNGSPVNNIYFGR